MCVKGYVYVYDGVPLYPGFSSQGATLLATLCGSNVDHSLTVTAYSGVMAVFFEAFLDPASASPCSLCCLCNVVVQLVN